MTQRLPLLLLYIPGLGLSYISYASNVIYGHPPLHAWSYFIAITVISSCNYDVVPAATASHFASMWDIFLLLYVLLMTRDTHSFPSWGELSSFKFLPAHCSAIYEKHLLIIRKKTKNKQKNC